MKKPLIEIKLMLNSASARERELALLHVGKYRHAHTASLCVAALKDESGAVRAAAAWALDQLSDPGTVEALVNALYDSDFTVRSNAGWALVHLAQRIIPTMIVPEVVDVLRQTENDHARQMAYLVLYHIDDQLSRNILREFRI